jgi:beta-glucuronidase
VGHNSWGKYDVYTPERVGEAGRLTHERMLEELVARDKNRPAVVMWSVANEAPTGEKNARAYFEPLVKTIRSLDSTRPITNVLNVGVEDESTIDMFDLICLNRYSAWYSDPGELGVIAKQMGDELKLWHEKFGMPIILSEFGADTIAGFHSLPDQMFSEEYQTGTLEEFFAVFDRLDFVIGEHIWNFADFMTKQGITRVIGNRKGIFTRDRQPKSAAFAVRRRWK